MSAAAESRGEVKDLALRNRVFALASANLGLAAALLVACNGNDGGTIVIAVQPTSTAAELTADASEIEEFLEERLDADVELNFPTTYAGVIEALRFGHADAAFMGAWPAALAVDEANAEVVLGEIRDVIIGDEHAEEPFYFSYWVVPTDSEYDSIEDLRGKRAAFPSQLSTSGFVAPMAKLVELGLIDPGDEGVDPEGFFSEAFFAGGYAQAWAALEGGQVDVTVIAGDVPEDLYNEVLDNTRVLLEQGPVPSHAVVFSEDFEGPEREQLIEALLDLGDPQFRALMRRFISGIFIRFERTTSEEHLASLNSFLEATNLRFTEAPPTTPSAQPDPEADPEPGSEATPEPDPEP
jgi:phosphonate transport system substrate-binding protein